MAMRSQGSSTTDYDFARHIAPPISFSDFLKDFPEAQKAYQETRDPVRWASSGYPDIQDTQTDTTLYRFDAEQQQDIDALVLKYAYLGGLRDVHFVNGDFRTLSMHDNGKGLHKYFGTKEKIRNAYAHFDKHFDHNDIAHPPLAQRAAVGLPFEYYTLLSETEVLKAFMKDVPLSRTRQKAIQKEVIRADKRLEEGDPMKGARNQLARKGLHLIAYTPVGWPSENIAEVGRRYIEEGEILIPSSSTASIIAVRGPEYIVQVSRGWGGHSGAIASLNEILTTKAKQQDAATPDSADH